MTIDNLNDRYQKKSSRRVPEWRWNRAWKLASGQPTPKPCASGDDLWVRATRKFILQYVNVPDKHDDLYAVNEDLFYAYELHQDSVDDPSETMIIEACLLAGMNCGEIAHLTGDTADTVNWYTKVFFDVQPYLEQRYWIHKKVIVPAMLRNMGAMGNSIKVSKSGFSFQDTVIARPFLDASLKLFGYHGGPILLDFLITQFRTGKGVTSHDDIDKFMDSQQNATIRRRSMQASQTFEINKYNVMELFEAHNKIMALEKGLDGSSTKQTTLERHVSSMLDEIPWTAGRNERDQKYNETPVAAFEAGSAAELRDDEIILASAKAPLPQGLVDAMKIVIPPPAKKER
jgi:hypothetical protein